MAYGQGRGAFQVTIPFLYIPHDRTVSMKSGITPPWLIFVFVGGVLLGELFSQAYNLRIQQNLYGLLYDHEYQSIATRNAQWIIRAKAYTQV